MSKFTELVNGNISDINQVSLYGATRIGAYAFYGCSSLESITIPASVTSIGEWVFYGCTNLTSITIPSSVTSIGTYAFGGSTTSSSKTITLNFLSENPASITLSSILFGWSGTFLISLGLSSNYIYADVHIPVGSEATYRANSNWNTFFNSSNVTVTADL